MERITKRQHPTDATQKTAIRIYATPQALCSITVDLQQTNPVSHEQWRKKKYRATDGDGGQNLLLEHFIAGVPRQIERE